MFGLAWLQVTAKCIPYCRKKGLCSVCQRIKRELRQDLILYAMRNKALMGWRRK